MTDNLPPQDDREARECNRIMQTAQPFVSPQEQIARIIDPRKWEVLDSYLAEDVRKTGASAYRGDRFKDKASLAKAAAILAAFANQERAPGVEEAMRSAENFVEFAPASKTVNPKPSTQSAACGTFWYAEGWINGQRYEYSTQDSRQSAEELCIRLNGVLRAALAAKPIANADWVMVPREPTEAMILAAVRATNGWRLGEGVSINDSIRAAFRAALSASPAHVAVSNDVEAPENGEPDPQWRSIKRAVDYFVGRVPTISKHRAANNAHIKAMVEHLDESGETEAADTIVWLCWWSALDRELERFLLADAQEKIDALANRPATTGGGK